ncbi:phosphatase PAP2 family protein [Leptolyngbya sp. NK1-12]|uniref:Phosphatase PAP2 family protein n=1 Tax=Leptolyngbya sp. NK1-12 TaxID=2547451 RepID=A0AA97AL35_9CYAN|nr:phosphatase PAP2 family protein [Leptolyngbya sp. NK1-12]WNZ26986.1 phosphatase PAP2 family protein [Leptolyngbya sp. NK1-12]
MQPFDPWNRLQSFTYFLSRWLQRNWQPLLFLFGTYVPLAIFAILAMQIWQLEGGLSWDVAIMQAIHANANATLDRIVPVWTKFGTRWGVFPVSTLIAVGLLYARRWRLLTYWLITLIGCVLINRIAKLWLHRVRPSLWEYPPVPEFSFPSGHAMASMGFVVALIILTWNTSWRIWVWLLGSFFVVSIGWTRLYLGVHYPSDILAGWMMSIAWAIGVSLIVKPLSSNQTSTSPSPQPSHPASTSASTKS